jgi:hypothetical protein
MLEIYHRLIPGILDFSTCNTGAAVDGKKSPRFWGCTKLLPHIAGFEILDVRLPIRGPVGLATTNTHMVLGAPGAFLLRELQA